MKLANLWRSDIDELRALFSVTFKDDIKERMKKGSKFGLNL